MFDKSLIDHEIDLVTELLYIHTGAGYSCMKGSVYFVLKFALPAFSPPECKFQNKSCKNILHLCMLFFMSRIRLTWATMKMQRPIL